MHHVNINNEINRIYTQHKGFTTETAHDKNAQIILTNTLLI